MQSAARSIVDRLAGAGIQMIERGSAGYPERLAEGMGSEAPARLYIQGDLARVGGEMCAVVGSRETTEAYCAAAFGLAEALSKRGIAVVSGLARGADSAAHAGAMQGAGGTIALPPRGLLREPRPPEGMTKIGIADPVASFHAGLAIRRDHAIAALSGGIVLVSTGPKGGSWHSVRWALRHGRPVWCLENGRSTPTGNAWLIAAKLAVPLSLKAGAESWAEVVGSGLGVIVRPTAGARRRLEQAEFFSG